jgi:hypothetical protein
MKSNLNSSAGTLYGHLTVSIFLYDVKTGRRRRTLRLSMKNQVTNAGRTAALALLCQDPAGTVIQANPQYSQLWSLAVGSDGTPPAVTDVSLYSEAARYSLVIPTEREYIVIPPNIFEIDVHKEIPAGVLTGVTLAEAGLYTRGDNDDPALAANQVLYARQIFPGVLKGATMSIEFDWKLGLLVQAP